MSSTHRSGASADTQHAEIVRARKIARILDDGYADPILGLLVPGIGDLVTFGFGLYLVRIAVRRALPVIVIARMIINLALDTAIGAIPVIGDVFDFVHKANRRNLRLLTARYDKRRSTVSDWLVVVLAVIAAMVAIVLPIYMAVRLVTWLLG